MKMNSPNICACFLLIAIGCCFAAPDSGRGNEPFDPLSEITKSFAGGIHLEKKGRTLEFCPDNTCDGFVASSNIPVATLKDFAYLYIYFFSDFYVLQEWRNRQESLNAAKSVLSRPEYHKGRSENDSFAARCVLSHLSRNGRLDLPIR